MRENLILSHLHPVLPPSCLTSILSHSPRLQDRDTQKIQWIDRFIEELRTNEKWVIPALKQIREICSLFGEAPQNLR